MEQYRRDDDSSFSYLWPCDAARLKEFMSPRGADEMPFRHMVPIMGSAPRSRSKLTSSKLPEKQTSNHQHHGVLNTFIQPFLTTFGNKNLHSPKK